MSFVNHLIPSSFHDTALVAASQTGSTITLSIEYYTEDDTEASAQAFIHGVEQITRDDVPISEFSMETDFASIVVLEADSKDIILFVNWIDFTNKTDTERFYRMLGADLRLSVASS